MALINILQNFSDLLLGKKKRKIYVSSKKKILTSQNIDKDNGMDRNKLIQKRNEYKHRVEQLERYMNGTKQTSFLYINENSPYQQRRDSCDSDIVRTEQDDYNDKAKVSTYIFLA